MRITFAALLAETLAACAALTAGSADSVARDAGAAAAYIAESGGMSRYINPNLDLALLYPGGFAPRVPETLREVLRREHLTALGGAERDPADYRVALRCMQTLFEATGDAAPQREPQAESAPETILVLHVDRLCVDGQIRGNRALDAIADVVLKTHELLPLVAPFFFAGNAHRIRSGMSSGMMIANGAAQGEAGEDSGRQLPVYIAAASLAQRQQWILVLYVSGTSGVANAAVGRMTVSFSGAPPVRLFPFLAGDLKPGR